MYTPMRSILYLILPHSQVTDMILSLVLVQYITMICTPPPPVVGDVDIQIMTMMIVGGHIEILIPHKSE